MSRVSTKPPSGMRDFLPDSVRQRRHVISVIQSVYESYGFVPLETPSIENLTTLLGKYGDEGDQLLFRILHRRDALKSALEAPEVQESSLADLGLRYDLTVPLARVAAQYNLPKFFKRYQIQPVWRADRPGKGRFREFYQCDVDITGSTSLMADSEACAAAACVLTRLGFDDFTIVINHRQLLRALIEDSGVDLSLEDSCLVALDKWDKVGVEGVKKEWEHRGILGDSASRLLSNIEKAESLDDTQTLEFLESALSSEKAKSAIQDLRDLMEFSSETPAGPHFKIDLKLARGLGYYTGCIFEVAVKDLPGSMGGGGRYDDLIGLFSKQSIPAVGFSLGLERILLVMEQRNLYPPLSDGPDVMLCWKDVHPKDVLRVAHQLRAQGLRVETYPEDAKLGKQIQYATNEGVSARAVVVLGPRELEEKQVTLKILATGEQNTLAIEDVGSQLL